MPEWAWVALGIFAGSALSLLALSRIGRANRAEVPSPQPKTTSLQPEDYDRLLLALRLAKEANTAVEELEADMKRRFGKLYAQQRRAQPDEPEEEPETGPQLMDPRQLSMPLPPQPNGRRLVPKASFTGSRSS